MAGGLYAMPELEAKTTRVYVMDLTRSQFKRFISAALGDRKSQEFKELYEFLLTTFNVADSDSDGLVSAAGFDSLAEMSAYVPRKFGYAPMTGDLFPTVEARTKARTAMFNEITQGAQKLTFDMWLNWMVKHLHEKTAQRGGWWSTRSTSLMEGNVTEFLEFCSYATGSSKSPEYRDLYHFLRDVFKTVDKNRDGRITPDEFHALVELAAQPVRHFGLAPQSKDLFKDEAAAKRSRAQLFAEIDAKGRFGASGQITFGKLLRWAVPHVQSKLDEIKRPGHKHGVHLVAYKGQNIEDLSKAEFKNFLYAATVNPVSAESKALRKWVRDHFTKADTDNDGYVRSKTSFDLMIDNAAYAPRKFGHAPMASAMYATEEARVAARAELFQVVSGGDDKISHEQWLQWCLAHIRTKVPRMGTARELMASADKFGFIGFLKQATGSPTSPEAMEFYYFLLNCFFQADVAGDGMVRAAEFDALVEQAADAPRKFGLAPATDVLFGSDAARIASRQALFGAMDTEGAGAITFNRFLAWAMRHVAGKVAAAPPDDTPVAPLAPVADVLSFSKTDFKHFVIRAANDESSVGRAKPGEWKGSERRTLHDFLLHCFTCADTDVNGLVGWDEFEMMIELAAAAPRKHGYAPIFARTYKAQQAKDSARKALFAEISAGKGSVSFYQFLAWCIEHLKVKVATIGSDESLMEGTKDHFIGFLKIATEDRTSPEYIELYQHLLRNFVGADGDRDGRINVEEFDGLVEIAAAAPRKFGLAPATSDLFATEAARKEARGKMFAAMSKSSPDTISFHEFLSWAVPHIQEKVGTALAPRL